MYNTIPHYPSSNFIGGPATALGSNAGKWVREHCSRRSPSAIMTKPQINSTPALSFSVTIPVKLVVTLPDIQKTPSLFRHIPHRTPKAPLLTQAFHFHTDMIYFQFNPIFPASSIQKSKIQSPKSKSFPRNTEHVPSQSSTFT